MGLLDQLTLPGPSNGSALSYGNGVTPLVNQGATSLSQLHAHGAAPGYSLDGSNFQIVNPAYQAYHDGVNNILPQPSQLDLNGLTPTQYLNNLPQ
jgi:hypothetical protein